MAELRKLTVRALRELARKHLGPGFSRLKTRAELLAALSKLPSSKAPEAAQPKGSPNPRANGARAQSPTPLAPEGPMTRRARPAEGRPSPAPASAPPAPTVAASAVSTLSPYDEQLGELPESYGEDAVVLLPKDPQCLYLYWDFSQATLERAFAWMPGLHTRLRLFDGERMVREVEFSVGARSWYLHGLSPARSYRVELVALAEDGQARRIGPGSNPMRLPPVGPSRFRDDRFVRVPFDVPASKLAEHLRLSLRSLAGGAGPASTVGPRPAFPVAAPGAGSLVPFVEPPPFPEESRERIYQASGGAARALGSSEHQPVPPAGAPADPKDAGLSPWSVDETNPKS